MKKLFTNCPVCRFPHQVEVEDDCTAVQDVLCPTCKGLLHRMIRDYRDNVKNGKKERKEAKKIKESILCCDACGEIIGDVVYTSKENTQFIAYCKKCSDEVKLLIANPNATMWYTTETKEFKE